MPTTPGRHVGTEPRHIARRGGGAGVAEGEEEVRERVRVAPAERGEEPPEEARVRRGNPRHEPRVYHHHAPRHAPTPRGGGGVHDVSAVEVAVNEVVAHEHLVGRKRDEGVWGSGLDHAGPV